MKPVWRWDATGYGIKGFVDGSPQVMGLINRTARGPGYRWEFSALQADDDKWGTTTTEESAKAFIERTYLAWLAARGGAR